MPEVDKWNLNEKMQYWMNSPEDKEMMEILFSPDECDILDTVHRFEILDCLVTEELEKENKAGSIEETFLRVEAEAEISGELKEKFMRRMDFLLGKGTAEAWIEIMIWYSLLERKKMIVEDYWEFPALRVVIDIFMKELNASLEKGGTEPVFVLSLRNMRELTDVYFRVIFLCRRIEYEVEPIEEIMDYIEEKRISPVFVRGIIQAAQIYNQEKIIKAIEERCWK